MTTDKREVVGHTAVVAEDKGQTRLTSVVGRFRQGELTLDEALVEVAAKGLVRYAGVQYIARANHQAWESLTAGDSATALLWARAAQLAYDDLRPPPKNLGLRLSRKLTAMVGLTDRVVAYSEYLAGIAASSLGRHGEARSSLLRALAIVEQGESPGFTVADCVRELDQIPG